MTVKACPRVGRVLSIWQFLAVVVGYLVIVQGIAIALAVDDDGRGTVGSVDAIVRSVIVPVGLGAAYVVAVAAVSGRWQQIYTDARRLRGWTWWLIAGFSVAILGLTNYGGLGAAGLLHSLVLLVAVLLVGFAEELLFRGIGMNSLRENGRSELKVALWSSLIFGVAHGSNAVVTGDVAGALLQVLLTTMTGAVFYLVFRITGVLVAAMAAHALWDLAILSTQIDLAHTHDIVGAAPVVIVGILLTVLLLRRRLTRKAMGSRSG